jgi:outer membrane protein
MNKLWKRFAAVMVITLTVGMLAGCGGEDKVGIVDMTRVAKEAPQAQQVQQKIKDKQASIEKELNDAKGTMSAEDFQKKQQQSQQEFQIFGQSMQQQFVRDVQGKLSEVAKEKSIGTIVYKDAVQKGGIDVTDDLIKKMQ